MVDVKLNSFPLFYKTKIGKKAYFPKLLLTCLLLSPHFITKPWPKPAATFSHFPLSFPQKREKKRTVLLLGLLLLSLSLFYFLFCAYVSYNIICVAFAYPPSLWKKRNKKSIGKYTLSKRNLCGFYLFSFFFPSKVKIFFVLRTLCFSFFSFSFFFVGFSYLVIFGFNLHGVAYIINSNLCASQVFFIIII